MDKSTVKMVHCPECGYEVTEKQAKESTFNYLCIGCGCSRIKDFVKCE